MWDLQGLNILIVEDEALLADDLANYVAEAGGTVLGPTSTLAQAATYLSRANAAILDINLNGHPVFSLADDLISLGVPFVFFSGCDDVDLPSRFTHLNYLRKPASREKLIRVLLDCTPHGRHMANGQRRQLGRHEDTHSVLRHETSPAEIMLLLPKFRRAARIMSDNTENGDHLVAQTLERAITEAARKPWDLPLLDWLNGIMDDCLASQMQPGDDRRVRRLH